MTIAVVRPKYRSSWFTPAQCLAYYKVPYQFREIQIHWWGDPNTKPTHAGIVSYIANKTGGSVNYVASDGKVTKMVDEENCALTTQGGNPYGIKIECSPYGTDGDYKTIGALVADIRKRHGNIPLVPHKKYWSTVCPGTLSLDRINKEANNTEDEMITLDQETVLYRLYLGTEVSATGKANVGKRTFKQEADRIKSSEEYKTRVAKSKAGTLKAQNHLPSALRTVYAPPTTSVNKASVIEYIEEHTT